MDQDNVDLLPCPFCGGEASIKETFEGDDGLYDIWQIACQHCPAEMRGERCSAPYDERDATIAAWNTRKQGHTGEGETDGR